MAFWQVLLLIIAAALQGYEYGKIVGAAQNETKRRAK